MLKRILLVLLVVFVGIQFIRPSKNVSSHPVTPDDLFERHRAPDTTRVAILHACYDCHSNSTRYPWYSEVQPLSWWLASHVRDGKEHLNFSEFGRLTPKRAARKLEESIEAIEDGSMPLKSYRLAHRDARLTPEQKKEIIAWLEATQEQIQPDSP